MALVQYKVLIHDTGLVGHRVGGVPYNKCVDEACAAELSIARLLTGARNAQECSSMPAVKSVVLK